MNVAQICRKALFEAGLITPSNGFSSPYITEEELLSWANEGNDELEKTLRNAEMDYLWRTLNSADASFQWENELYDPTDFSFTGDVSIRTFTLPPDLLILKEIRITSSGQQETLFQHADQTSPIFQDIIRSDNPQRDLIYYDMVDERTLYVANPPSGQRAVQLSYVQRSPRMRFYNTGTISTTQGLTAVTGSGTEWLIENLDNAGKMEIGFADSGALAVNIAGVTAPFAVINEPDFPVASFTTDTALILDTAFRRVALAGVGYYLATRPETPREHHHLLATYVKMKIQEKLKNYADQGQSQKLLDQKYAKVMSDIQDRQLADPEFVEEYDPEI